MRRMVRLFCWLTLFSFGAMVQNAQAAPRPSGTSYPNQSASAPAPKKKPAENVGREVPLYEISGGFAYRSYYQPANGLNPYLIGWYGSVERNIFSWLGAEAEGVGTYKDQGVIVGNTRIYSFMGGPVFYPLKHHRLTPYGHVLVGVSILRNSVGPYGGFAATSSTATVRSWEVGGGLEYVLSHHWAVRLIQYDLGGSNFTNSNNNQAFHRITAGIVYRFGQK